MKSLFAIKDEKTGVVVAKDYASKRDAKAKRDLLNKLAAQGKPVYYVCCDVDHWRYKA